MVISTVETQASGNFKVTTDLGEVWNVPDDMSNRHRRKIQAWVDAGGVIAPYVAPPPPTDEERIDSAFPQTDVARVIFEAFFEISNRLAVLEGGQPITRLQLKTWLKAKLP